MQILHKMVNKALASLGYQKVPRFPQAGVGSGIIFYRADPNTPWVLHVSCAQRSAKVGAGWGIGCGGWLELASLPTLPPQTVLHDEDSALREGMEEIPGLFSVIPVQVLRDRLFYLTGFAVHVPHDPYGNYFHYATYFACPVTAQEEAGLKALPKSDETAAPLSFFGMHWLAGEALTAPLTGLPENFHHAHELQSFRALADRADTNRLPYLKG